MVFLRDKFSRPADPTGRLSLIIEKSSKSYLGNSLKI